jgi:carbon storage regulator
MLVFTRRRHETIMIGVGIVVRVLRSGRAGVRLGSVAPPDVRVHRQEIYNQIRDANRSTADTPHPMAAIAARLRQQK